MLKAVVKNTSKSDTTKQKISNSLKGKKHSEETKQKIKVIP